MLKVLEMARSGSYRNLVSIFATAAILTACSNSGSDASSQAVQASHSVSKKEYVIHDFVWDEQTTPYQKKIVAVVNKIVHENDRCDSVEPDTLARDEDRGTPKKPVFFITCKAGGLPFNVWFEPGDAAHGHQFAAVGNIDQTMATIACENAARQAAANPHSVSFSKLLDVSFSTYPSGRSRLSSSFTAKNAMNAESKFTISCFFDGTKMIESNVEQALD